MSCACVRHRVCNVGKGKDMYIYIFMYIFLYFIFNSEKFIFNNFGTIPGYSISIIYYFTPNGKDKALNTLKTSLKTTKKKK